MLRHRIDQGRVDTLRRLELFRSCNDHSIDLLARTIDEEVVFPAGKLLCDQGKPAQCCYIVLEGEVEVRVAGEPVATVRAGHTVGERGVLGRAPRNATVVAATEVRVYRLNDSRLRKLTNTAPGVISALQYESNRREAAIATAS